MMMMICLRKLQVASDPTGRLNPLNLTAVTPIPNEIVSRSKPKRNSSPVNTQIVGHMTLAPPPVRSDADAYFLLKPKAFFFSLGSFCFSHRWCRVSRDDEAFCRLDQRRASEMHLRRCSTCRLPVLRGPEPKGIIVSLVSR